MGILKEIDKKMRLNRDKIDLFHRPADDLAKSYHEGAVAAYLECAEIVKRHLTSRLSSRAETCEHKNRLFPGSNICDECGWLIEPPAA